MGLLTSASAARAFAAISICALNTAAQLPAIHRVGPLLAASSEPMTAVSQARVLSDGHVLVNDNGGRRVLLFDSTLTTVVVVADSTAATGFAYGSRLGGLVAYHGDSSLFVDPASLSMQIIDASGKIGRTLAAPRAADVAFLIGGPFGTPALDRSGRLVYRSAIRSPTMPALYNRGLTPCLPDSALIVRLDLISRRVDTVAKLGIPRTCMHSVVNDKGEVVNLRLIVDPIATTDDWAVLSDGTIAIVRGKDYHVDFFRDKDSVLSTAKIPFKWRHLSDEDKQSLLDSLRTQQATAPLLQTLPDFVPAAEVTDYFPAFRQGAARGDADGNVWVRTTESLGAEGVYDVIDSHGALTDRVALPSGRVVVGFGRGGIVYMSVLHGSVAALERARVR